MLNQIKVIQYKKEKTFFYERWYADTETTEAFGWHVPSSRSYREAFSRTYIESITIFDNHHEPTKEKIFNMMSREEELEREALPAVKSILELCFNEQQNTL